MCSWYTYTHFFGDENTFIMMQNMCVKYNYAILNVLHEIHVKIQSIVTVNRFASETSLSLSLSPFTQVFFPLNWWLSEEHELLSIKTPSLQKRPHNSYPETCNPSKNICSLCIGSTSIGRFNITNCNKCLSVWWLCLLRSGITFHILIVINCTFTLSFVKESVPFVPGEKIRKCFDLHSFNSYMKKYQCPKWNTYLVIISEWGYCVYIEILFRLNHF